MNKLFIFMIIILFLNVFSSIVGADSVHGDGDWERTVEVLSGDEEGGDGTMNSTSSGNWTRTVNVSEDAGEPPTPSNMVVNNSGSWTRNVYIEYYTWTDWSDWWEMWFNGTTPTVSSPDPSDNSYNVDVDKVNLSVIILDSDSTFNWTIETYPDIGTNTSNDDSNGTKDVYVSGNLSYGVEYTWYVNVTDGATTANESYTFMVENLSNVSNIAVENYNSTAINITWSKTANITSSYVVRKIESAPSSRVDGTFVVNTTNTSYNDTGLNLGTVYYYSIWSYNSSGNVFSATYAHDYNYTNPGGPDSLQDTSSNMTTITFSWNKGTNATRTVVFCNATGETGPPNQYNGTEVINVTGSSGTTSTLTLNTTYNFTAFSFCPGSGLWSETNSTDSAATTADAGAINDFTVSRYNDTQLNLSWTKTNPTDTTVIRRLKYTTPTSTTGTEVYNGSFSTYKDTGLDPATKYCYRVWAWNGETLSSTSATDCEITRPEPPQNFTGDIDGSELSITWDKGEGATRTVIRNQTGSYPTSTSNGNGLYNDTGESTIVSGVNSINYIRGWCAATINGTYVESLPQNLLWGGLEINSYNENNPSIALLNYTVFIKNQDGSQTYINSTANNPCRIDVTDVPNGEDIIIQVSKDGYKSRSKTMDLFQNAWYVVNFYLPPDAGGGGQPGEPDYIPPDDDNITYSEQYSLFVVGPKDQYNADPPIEDAYISIEFYNNVTEVYDEVFTDSTDANGQTSCWLVPGTVYQVTITHDDYITEEISSFIPREIVYADDWKYTFRMVPIDSTTGKSYDLFWENVTYTAEMSGPGYPELGNVTVVYFDSNSSTTDINIYLYEIYDGVTTYLNETSASDDNDVTIIFGDINTTRSHKVVLYFNNTATFTDVESPVIIPLLPIDIITDYDVDFDERVTDLIGPLVLNNIDVGWHSFLAVIIAIALLVLLGPYHTGLGIIAAGLGLGLTVYLFAFFGFSDDLDELFGVLSILFVIIGVIYMWTKHKGVETL